MARFRNALIFPALATFNFAVWGWSIANGFVFDDLVNIGKNHWITDWSHVLEAFTHHAAGFDPAFSTSFYRPLMHVFYAVCYTFAGPRPWVFHLLNVGMHVVAVLCAYALTGAVLKRWSDGARYRYLPLIAALVFSVHPVHTEAVAWAAGITDLSYTVFGLIALTLYVRAFAYMPFAWVSGLFLLASMLSKETGVVLLLVIGLLEAIEKQTREDWRPRAALRRLLPALVAALVYATMRFAALGSFAPSARQYPHSMTQLGAAGAALFAHYLQVLAAPVQLNIMRSIPLSAGFADPFAVAGLLAVAALLAFVVRFRRSPLALLSVALATFPILPALYIPAVESGSSLFGERYLYLPVIGIGWCLGFALEETRHRFSPGRFVSLGLMLVFVLWSSATVVARNRVWADSLTLWTDAVAKSPNMAAAHEGLCFALYEGGRFSDAVQECATAIALDPKRVDARVNRATALLALGNGPEALREVDAALSMRPNSPEALVTRGLACMIVGRPDEALLCYRRALQLAPEFAEAHNDLGVALVRLGRAHEGLSHLEQAVRFAPERGDYRANLEACPR